MLCLTVGLYLPFIWPIAISRLHYIDLPLEIHYLQRHKAAEQV